MILHSCIYVQAPEITTHIDFEYHLRTLDVYSPSYLLKLFYHLNPPLCNQTPVEK